MQLICQYDVSPPLSSLFPLLLPPLTVRSSSPLFSPQGSYITSTQLIFSKIINELHCVCMCVLVRGEN